MDPTTEPSPCDATCVALRARLERVCLVGAVHLTSGIFRCLDMSPDVGDSGARRFADLACACFASPLADTEPLQEFMLRTDGHLVVGCRLDSALALVAVAPGDAVMGSILMAVKHASRESIVQ